MNSYDKAITIIDDFPLDSKKEFLFLINFIRTLIQCTKTNRQLTKEETKKYQSLLVINKNQVKISINKKVLSSKYPYISLAMGVYKIEIQPIFSYPVIRPLDILPIANDFLLLQLTPSLVTCVPEAPWIKRSSYGINFTNEAQITGSINSTKTEHNI